MRSSCWFGVVALAVAGTVAGPAHAALEESASAPTWIQTAMAVTGESEAFAGGAPGIVAMGTAPEVRALAVDALAEADDGPLTPALGVWLVVRRANALRSGDAFAALDSNLDTLALLPSEPPAAVPLPASAWLLLTGLLGFVGARLRRHGLAADPRWAERPAQAAHA